MNKILRFSVFTLLTLMSSITFAQTTQVTFDANQDKGTKTQNGKPDQVVKDGVTLHCTNAAMNVANAKTKKEEYRSYKGSTITLSANKNITKIVFTCDKNKSYAPANFKAQDGFVIEQTTATWTGKATTVTFHADKQVRAFKVEVTLEGGEVKPTPTPTPPTPAPTPTPQIKTADNIAAFMALSKGDVATLKLKDAQVIYKHIGKNKKGKAYTQVYLRDVSGAILLYNPSLTLNANDVLNGEVTLKVDEFYNVKQAATTKETTNDKLDIKQGIAATPKTVTIEQLKDNLHNLVQVENVTIKSETSGKYTNYYAFVGEQKAQLFNGFHLDAYNDMKTFENKTEQTVKGIVSIFKGKHQITIISIDKTTGIAKLRKTNTANNTNAPMYNLAGQRVSNTYKGIVIQNGRKIINR